MDLLKEILDLFLSQPLFSKLDTYINRSSLWAQISYILELDEGLPKGNTSQVISLKIHLFEVYYL